MLLLLATPIGALARAPVAETPTTTLVGDARDDAAVALVFTGSAAGPPDTATVTLAPLAARTPARRPLGRGLDKCWTWPCRRWIRRSMGQMRRCAAMGPCEPP